MNTPARARTTQTCSFTEFLRGLRCSLLLAEGRRNHLSLLGADGDGLIRHKTLLAGTELVACQGEQVAAWGRRRLEMLSRGRLLDGRGPGILGRLLAFGTTAAGDRPGHLVALQWGRAGLWGVEPTAYGLLDLSGRYRHQPMPAPGAKAGTTLSGLAAGDGELAFLTGYRQEPGQGCIMDAGSGEVLLSGLDCPSSPLLIDSALYLLEGQGARVVCCDLRRGGRTTVVRLPAPASRMLHFGAHLLIALAGPHAGLCCLHLGSGRLTVLRGWPAEGPVRLLAVIAGTPRRTRPLAAAAKAASVAVVTGLALTQTPPPARAATVVFTEVIPNIPLYDVVIPGSTFNPTFVDIDHDGDQDLFAGTSDGTIHYFENTGSATAPVMVERTGAANPLNAVDIGFDSIPAFVDIDGDGDQDAFIGETDGKVNYFENTGTVNAPVFTERIGPANPFDGVDVGYASAPTFVDIDGDLDFDAFIGQSNGNVNYFENTGTVNAPTLVERTDAANPLNSVDVGSESVPAFVDIDNDKDLDAFVGESSGNVNYFENTGTVNAPVLVERTGTANPLDGIEVMNESSPAFVDIDGDGDQDLFLGEYPGQVIAFRNDGSASTPDITAWDDPAVPLSDKRTGQLSRPSFADLDGDGDLDAFIGGIDRGFKFIYGYGSTPITYFENTGTRTAPVMVERTDTANPLYGFSGLSASPTFVDIDGDGDLDAFVGGIYGQVDFIQNFGTRTEPIMAQRFGSGNPLNGVHPGYFTSPAFVDIDGDGDLDAFVGAVDIDGYSSAITYFENTGTRTTPVLAERTGAANPLNGATNLAPTPAFANLDGDGDFDAFIGNKYGTIDYFENTGFGAGPAMEPRTMDNPLAAVQGMPMSAPAFADLDGDGDLDAFIGDYYGKIRYFRNDTPKRFPWAVFLPNITNNGK
jgi:hypothetical protein